MSAPHDDYLWDPRQPADAELQALEAALAPLRHRGGALDPDLLPPPRRRRRPMRWLVGSAALAAAVLLGWILTAGDAPLAPGSASRRLRADAAARQVAFGEIATVELLPGTELEFEHWRADELRLRLERGAIAVRVAPPPAVAPRFFRVDTPRGSVVDLGCRYELRALPDGRESVRVTEGAVEFALPQRTVFVPAGAECMVDGERPSTPTFVDTDRMLVDTVGKFDALSLLKVAPSERLKFAAVLAERCGGGRDTLILWHLLRDPDPDVRALAEARLYELEGAPPGAEPGIAKGDPPHADAEVWLPFLRQGAWATAR